MSERTYEMLWDCAHCGTRKNLGLTHRHCPSCGSPQPAEARYFPAEEDKVAVEDHQFVGTDLKCAYCGALSGRASAHCGGCGAPLTEGSDATRQNNQVGAWGGGAMPATGAGAAAPTPAAQMPSASTSTGGGSNRNKLIGCGCLGLLGVAVIGFLVMMFWKKDGQVEVAGHAWTRTVQIQQKQQVEDSAWCDETPRNVQVTRRARQERSTRQVQDGQDCRTVRQDNGDGTFTERQECEPRYRNEPVYAERCFYLAERWQDGRVATASGASVTDAPRWPVVQLQRTGECLGCEREGARQETYTVHFRNPADGSSHSCNFPEARWRSFAMGSSHPVQFSGMTSNLDCGSLE